MFLYCQTCPDAYAAGLIGLKLIRHVDIRVLVNLNITDFRTYCGCTYAHCYENNERIVHKHGLTPCSVVRIKHLTTQPRYEDTEVPCQHSIWTDCANCGLKAMLGSLALSHGD